MSAAVVVGVAQTVGILLPYWVHLLTGSYRFDASSSCNIMYVHLSKTFFAIVCIPRVLRFGLLGRLKNRLFADAHCRSDRNGERRTLFRSGCDCFQLPALPTHRSLWWGSTVRMTHFPRLHSSASACPCGLCAAVAFCGVTVSWQSRFAESFFISRFWPRLRGAWSIYGLYWIGETWLAA